MPGYGSCGAALERLLDMRGESDVDPAEIEGFNRRVRSVQAEQVDIEVRVLV